MAKNYIDFEVRDWDHGFWVSFRIPYTDLDWEAVFTIRRAANIRLVRR